MRAVIKDPRDKKRKQSRSPNAQVYWRANQFPSSRLNVEAVWGKAKIEVETDEEETLPEDEQQKLNYLRDRFKSTYTSGTDDAEGPCG